MIIDDKVLIKISKANVRFYKNKYNCIVGDYMLIDTKDLSRGCCVEVKVMCDICNCIKKLSFKKYLKNIKNQSIYTCSSKCSTIKKKNTLFENFGDRNFNNRKKFRETCISKYGVDYPMRNDLVREKSEKTCLIKYNSKNFVNSDKYLEKMFTLYGVTNPMKSIDINSKRIKSSFSIDSFNEIKYQGKYELDFLKFCKENLLSPIKPEFTINYIHDGKIKIYIPDFYFELQNLVIEIKSSYYYNLHKVQARE